jgi:anti-sigma regulatory factor (Ser/Thr protein kinase)
MHLFRITQESINNVLRHAQASAIEIHLIYQPKQLQIAIVDNGCGFESTVPTRGFGIKGMQPTRRPDWSTVADPQSARSRHPNRIESAACINQGFPRK